MCALRKALTSVLTALGLRKFGGSYAAAMGSSFRRLINTFSSAGDKQPRHCSSVCDSPLSRSRPRVSSLQTRAPRCPHLRRLEPTAAERRGAASLQSHWARVARIRITGLHPRGNFAHSTTCCIGFQNTPPACILCPLASSDNRQHLVLCQKLMLARLLSTLPVEKEALDQNLLESIDGTRAELTDCTLDASSSAAMERFRKWIETISRPLPRSRTKLPLSPSRAPPVIRISCPTLRYGHVVTGAGDAMSL